MVIWQKSDISTAPPYVQLAMADRLTLSVAAGQAFASVTAQVRDLDRNQDVTSIALESVTPASPNATVVVRGLAPGNYRLSVHFTTAGGDTFTRTKILEVVA